MSWLKRTKSRPHRILVGEDQFRKLLDFYPWDKHLLSNHEKKEAAKWVFLLLHDKINIPFKFQMRFGVFQFGNDLSRSERITAHYIDTLVFDFENDEDKVQFMLTYL